MIGLQVGCESLVILFKSQEKKRKLQVKGIKRGINKEIFERINVYAM